MAEMFTVDELRSLQERAESLAKEHESDAGLRAALQVLGEAAANLNQKLPGADPARGAS